MGTKEGDLSQETLVAILEDWMQKNEETVLPGGPRALGSKAGRMGTQNKRTVHEV